jgi:hypothetical protein
LNGTRAKNSNSALPDIPGAVPVGMGSEATPTAQKGRLRVAVRFLAVPAPATRRAGVAWIDQHERHATVGALVGQERGELPEGPTAVGASLLLSNLYASAYALQVLDTHSAARGLSRLRDLLG